MRHKFTVNVAKDDEQILVKSVLAECHYAYKLTDVKVSVVTATMNIKEYMQKMKDNKHSISIKVDDALVAEFMGVSIRFLVPYDTPQKVIEELAVAILNSRTLVASDAKTASYIDFELVATTSLTFEEVLPEIKKGRRARRSGWNGKGMSVAYQPGYIDGVACSKQTAECWGINEGDTFKLRPYLQIRDAEGMHTMWVPSIGDILAEDWELI